MKDVREYFKNPKDLPLDDYITPGTSLCAGCGGLETLRLMLKVLGPNVVIVNAAGCMTMLATFPFTPLKSSWLYTTMASAAGGAQGVRDALDVLLAKGEISPAEDLHLLVLAGDGSTYDMGLSSTSAAIHRGLNFWYLCYDNEAYGNTGFQLSSASPTASQTSTSLDASLQRKKDIFGIWVAHRPAYAATICTHESVDLAEKVRRAMRIRGPKLFLSLAVCPTGWGTLPELGDELARLAVETGVWPLKEYIDGAVRHTYIPNKLHPVEEYLEPQERFGHLFRPQRAEAQLRRIQAEIAEYWDEVRRRNSNGKSPCLQVQPMSENR